MSVANLIADGVTPEMIAATNAKFSLWDDIVERNLVESENEEDRKYVYELLDDPTIYAYAFFRDAETGKPYKCYPYQDVILNDNSDRVMFVAANQVGKSSELCIEALTYALKNPGKTVLMVSKTLPQAKDLLRTIKNFLMTSTVNWQYDIGDTDTKTEVYFKHFDIVKDEEGKEVILSLPESRIICVPATEAALGYAAHKILADEIAFFDNGEHFYFQILQPRVYHTKGQIKLFSNPNGMQGIFWMMWNSDTYRKYRFNFLDCPKNTKEEFEKLAKDMTQERIDSTLLAVFTNPEGGFLTVQEREAIQDKNMSNVIPLTSPQPLYVFFDFAKSRDRTVRGIGRNIGTLEEPNIEVVEIVEYPQGTPYDEIIDDLCALVAGQGAKLFGGVGWDNTGVGRGIEDFIKRVADYGIPCSPVDFTLENKSRMYTLFKLLAERTVRGQKSLSIPFIYDCDKQLASLRFQKTTRGYLQVHHEKESDRDDFPDMIAGLCNLIIQPENAPITVDLLEGEFEKKCERCGFILATNDVECAECKEPYDDWLGIV